MKRESGYYWVRFKKDIRNSNDDGWRIAEWDGELWWIFGYDYGHKEPIQIFEEIDETPITRNP